jgi:hypothetical protein
LQGKFPPPSVKQIFFAGWQPQQFTADYARRIFARLLPRAYRRPVTGAEVDEIVQLVNAELDRGQDYPEAIKVGVVAMLCSPKFLYLYEPTPGATTPRELNEFELATRLSYFLWSSKPDDELFRLAGDNQLSNPGVLDQQVDRMLADRRVEGFMQGFVRQWLKIDEFDRFPPDERIFPKYYETQFNGIAEDIRQQPLAMVSHLLRSDESLIALLDSDWTMVNERLASFYGITDVAGDQFQKVALTGDTTIRGGLLGMAGVHRWGSDGNRTKPVERGKYVLDVLFNDPPPPPPPNAGEVEPNIQGEKLTIRERLSRHRQQVTCNNCHRRIDGYGLALENFNVIGRWREKLDGEKPLAHWGDDRPTIDASGTLPSGEHYSTYAEFKRALLKQQDRFLRGLSEKLLMYALARTIEASDRPLIDVIVTTAKQNGYSMRSMLKAIAASAAFQQK